MRPRTSPRRTLVVAIVGEAGAFDAGRCMQNMMLGAWGDGVVSCPNGIRDADAAAADLRRRRTRDRVIRLPGPAARPGEPQRGRVVGAGQP